MQSIRKTLTLSLATATLLVYIFAVAAVVVLEYSQDPVASRCLTTSQILREALTIEPNGDLSVRQTGEMRNIGSGGGDFWYAIFSGGKSVESDPARRPQLPFGFSPEQASAAANSRTVDPARSVCLDIQHIGDREVILMASKADVTFWQFTVSFLTRAAFELSVVGIGFAALAAAGTMMAVHFVERSILRVTRLALAIDPKAPQGSIPLRNVPRELVALITALNSSFDEISTYISRQRRFIGNAAHELRTPLTLLRAKMEDIPDPAKRAELIGDLRRLTSLVAAMLDLAQLQAETVGRQSVDLETLVLEVLADLAPSALDAGLELSFENVCRQPVYVHGVEPALRSAVANIIGNALLHARGATSVVVALDRGTIFVTDDGEGVRVGQELTITEPFQRGESSRGAAGLGLSIVKEIMNAHGGTLSIERAQPHGTTVTLHFPASPAATA